MSTQQAITQEQICNNNNIEWNNSNDGTKQPASEVVAARSGPTCTVRRCRQHAARWAPAWRAHAGAGESRATPAWMGVRPRRAHVRHPRSAPAARRVPHLPPPDPVDDQHHDRPIIC